MGGQSGNRKGKSQLPSEKGGFHGGEREQAKITSIGKVEGSSSG